ncbi:MAG: hypothetical protein KAY59_10305, partial [Acidobacteria bacterium]|nr:hypothetical protein [Acidobacteriota bacterium]
MSLIPSLRNSVIPSFRHSVIAAALAAVFLLGGGLSAQGPDRSKAPALGPAPALKLPPIVKRTLSNGLPVWIVEMHKVPLVDVTLIVK